MRNLTAWRKPPPGNVRIEYLERENAKQIEERDHWKRRSEDLEKELEAARRAGRRRAVCAGSGRARDLRRSREMRKSPFFHLVAGLCVATTAVSCGDDPAPTAPSLIPAGGASPVAAAGGGSPAAPPARQADLQPAASTAGVRRLQPGQGRDASSFNAYDFQASWDGSMLHLALIEDEMRSMREASKPHRNRLITVETCPGEPHHALQSCGAPIWSGTRMLTGRLELPPIPLAECEGWIVVNAAELSDDQYDGWRNAPCPDPDGETPVGSDGSGEGWPEYPDPEPPAESAAQSTVDATIAAAGGLVAGRGQLDVVDVRNLFKGTEGTTGDDYRPTSSDVTVATVEMTSNPRVRVTPVGAGTATIEVVFLRSEARVDFDVTVFFPLPLHELPFTRADSGVDTETGSLDLTSFSIARPDASGWAAVTFTTADVVDPTALGVHFTVAVDTEARPDLSEQWHMRIRGSAWDFGYDPDVAPDDGNPYVRTSQSTAAASSFSFEIRLIPEIRNQVAWLHVGAYDNGGGFDELPGDAVEAAGGETFIGREATMPNVFGERYGFVTEQSYRVMIP